MTTKEGSNGQDTESGCMEFSVSSTSIFLCKAVELWDEIFHDTQFGCRNMTMGVEGMETGQTQRHTHKKAGARWAVPTVMDPYPLSQQPGTLSAFISYSTERRS